MDWPHAIMFITSILGITGNTALGHSGNGVESALIGFAGSIVGSYFRGLMGGSK